MRHLISIGGGFSSTIELPLAVIGKYGAENADMVISCLAGESPDLWRLVQECERLTGKPVKRITYSPYRQYLEDAPPVMWWDIWDVFNQQGMMGNSLADPCSRILKRETLRAYIEDCYDPRDTVLHVGITAEEIDRMMAIQKNWGRKWTRRYTLADRRGTFEVKMPGYRVEADLADAPRESSSTERCKALLGWTPRLYEWGASHNNCGGFCVKAGHSQMARLLWHEPDLYAYHEAKEAQFQEAHHTTATIMRDRKVVRGKSTTTPLSMRQFRDRCQSRWGGMLFPPFDELEDTPGCKWCEAA